MHLSNIDYILPDGKYLFHDFSFEFSSRVTGIVGRNGIGKSILAKIISGVLKPATGNVISNCIVGYVPQSWDGNTTDTIVDALKIRHITQAIENIKRGSATDVDYDIAENNWGWQGKIRQFEDEVLTRQLIEFEKPVSQYSGGEQLLIALIATLYNQPNIVVLDEPSNHLDREHRELLINWIKYTKKIVIFVSHDPELLRVAEGILELSENGLFYHGGNYDLYHRQRESRIENSILKVDKAKSDLTRERKEAQHNFEKQQQKQSRGKCTAQKTGMSAIEIGAAKENSSSSRKRIATASRDRINTANIKLKESIEDIEITKPINFDLSHSAVEPSQQVLTIENLRWGYEHPFSHQLSLNIIGPMRIHLSGPNGAGKTALLKTIYGDIKHHGGNFKLFHKAAYLDQMFSFLKQDLSALDNFLTHNPGWSEFEYRKRLAWLRFRGDKSLSKVSELSGGEKLKLAIACILLGPDTPRLILLDEPTNHLDIDSRTALVQAIQSFKGALIVASHDSDFIEKIGCEVKIEITNHE